MGLLHQLFHAAEHRGHDSSGVAFWDDELGQNYLVKHAVTASLFTKINSDHVNRAQRATRGIAHTRRASKNMPINNANAHPFMYGSYVFAHNGTVKNWKTLRDETAARLEKEAKCDQALENKLAYIKQITTDSMILGPAIEASDFSPCIGSFGLVWLYGNKLYAFRSKKELTSANVVWTVEGQKEEHNLTIVASVWDIIETALAKLANIQYDAVETLLKENTLYSVETGSVNEIGPVPVNQANATDQFTSQSDGK